MLRLAPLLMVAACSGARVPSVTFACSSTAECLDGLVCASDKQCRHPDEPVPVPPLSKATFVPATGVVGSRVIVHTTLAAFATQVTIGGTRALVLRRSSDTIDVLVMPSTTTGPVTVTAPTALAVSEVHFEVRKAAPPTQLRQTIRFDGGTALGQSLAIDAEGSLALLGEGGPDVGLTVHVQIIDGGVFNPEAGSLLDRRPSQLLPVAVALSADGTRALVGDGATAQVFLRSGDAGWLPEGLPLEPTDAIGASSFGSSVALSADGTTAAVGAPSDDTAKGASWVFTRDGDTWRQQGPKLIGVGGRSDAATRQGNAVALDAAGNTLVVGGSGAGNTRGAAWVYTRHDGVWTQRSRLTDETNAGAPRFGTSVAVSADGATIAIGGPTDAISVGAVWVYARAPDETWVLEGEKLTPGGRAGSSVAVSFDGTRLLVGCPRYNSAVGRAMLYERADAGWSTPNELFAADAQNPSGQGSVVTLSLDGHTALVSGVLDDSGAGAVWIYGP